MITGTFLFLNLTSNLGIFIALVAGYSVMYTRLGRFTSLQRQVVHGIYFGIFSIGCMQINIPVSPGVLLDQRNSMVLLGGFFGGPVAGAICGSIAAAYQIATVGSGMTGWYTSMAIAVICGSALSRYRKVIDTFPKAAAAAVIPSLLITASLFFLNHGAKTAFMTAAIPYCCSLYAGILLAGILIANGELRESSRLNLIRSEKKYRDLFESIVDVTYCTDSNNKIEIISPSVEKMLGYTTDELTGTRLALLFKDQSVFDDYHSELRRNECVKNFEAQIRKKDGTFIWISLSVQIKQDENGTFSGEEGVVRDISSVKNREEEDLQRETALRQNQKMESIGTLAGGIAHDFNNILAAIIGYAEMAQQKIEGNSLIGQDIEGIIRSASRAKDLVRHILIFSRRTSYDAGPVEMYLMIKEVIKMVQATIPENITIEQTIKCRNGVVLADPTEIHQVILNLCTNAVEAMAGSKGVMTVLLEKNTLTEQDLAGEPELQPGQYIALSVQDTGVGIPPENLERVFDPFFTTKEVGKGSGLGLSVVHGIIKRLGGITTIRSVPGQGTSVTISLPEMKNESNGTGDQESDLPSGHERILFIDDEPVVADVTRKLLENLGYHVTVNTSSEAALQQFKEQPNTFDLVITDQTMPVMTGEQLSRAILSIRPDIPVIMCTGYSVDIDAETAKTIGISKYIMKPIEKKNLAMAIRSVLDSHLIHA